MEPFFWNCFYNPNSKKKLGCFVLSLLPPVISSADSENLEKSLCAKENAKKEYYMAEAVGEHCIKNRPDSVMEIAACTHEHV